MFKHKILHFLVLLVAILFSSICSLSAYSADEVTYPITASSYRVEKDENDKDLIYLDDFDVYQSPGDPIVPYKTIRLAIHPDADIYSIHLAVSNVTTETLPGEYELAAAPPAASSLPNGQIIHYWGEGKNIIDGVNQNVYQTDADYPGRLASIVQDSQLRKWKFVVVEVFPLQYNPATKKATLVTSMTLELSYARQLQALPSAGVLQDTVFDTAAGKILDNYSQAKPWYTSVMPQTSAQASPVSNNYVIITTNAIVTNSTKLSDFITHKTNMGFTVGVITESDFGGLTGQAPNGTAEKIRQWLINNYASGIEYVLLIGNPTPGTGDIPMKSCQPTTDYDSPTDYFYADLTGNWDLDGDQIYGEYNGDGGTGGVDFAPEVYVGRIPVYNADYTTLDNILQKIIVYETPSGDLSWRNKALLPMSYSDADTDGAYLAEAMKDDYLNASGFTSYTLYMQGTFDATADSAFTSDAELRGGVTQTHWQSNHYGVVDWWGHGSTTGAHIGHDGIGWDGTIMTSGDCSSLNDNYPAHVYSTSCTNGYPESSNNLGYALLKKGAVSTISASRISWYAIGSFFPSVNNSSNANFGYYYIKDLATNNTPCGKALFDMKAVTGSWWGGLLWMNRFDFNLYGDPSVKLIEDSIEIDTTVSSGPSTPWQDSNVTFEFTANKPVKCYYFKLWPIETGYTKTTLTAKYYNNLSDGVYQFIVFARGFDDVLDTTPARWSFTISIPPDEINTRITSGPEYVDHDGDVEFTYEANLPVKSFYYRLYGLESTYTKTTDTTKTYTGLADGDYQFIVFARASDGTLETSAARWTFKVLDEIDTTITLGPDSPDTDGNVAFQYIADRPAQSYYYRLWPVESGYTNTTSTTKWYGSLGNGEYQFIVFARDTLGNLETTPAIWNFTVILPGGASTMGASDATPAVVTANIPDDAVLIEQYPNAQADYETIALFKYIPFTLTQDGTAYIEVVARCSSGVNDDDLVVVLRNANPALPAGSKEAAQAIMAFSGDEIDSAISTINKQMKLPAGDYTLEFYAQGAPTLHTVKVSTAPLADIVDAQINQTVDTTKISLVKQFDFEGGGDVTVQVIARAKAGVNDDDVAIYLDETSFGMNTPLSIDGDVEKGIIRVLSIPIIDLPDGRHTVSLVCDGSPKIYAVRVLKGLSTEMTLYPDEEISPANGNMSVKFSAANSTGVVTFVLAALEDSSFNIAVDGMDVIRDSLPAGETLERSFSLDKLTLGKHTLSISTSGRLIVQKIYINTQ